MYRRLACLALAAGLLAALPSMASEWAQWRGPFQTGVSPETGLVSTWSLEGENLIWRAPFTGRSTPAVFDGRICAIGRTGTGIDRQEVVSCWDAGDGHLLWERKFNVYGTTVPFSRAGWAGVAGDPETGYVYAQGVDGHLWCLDRQGKTVWEWNLSEDVGRFSGYGGRTHTPILDEDQLLISVISSSWGPQAPPRHRFFSFDKKTGIIRWVSTVSDGVKDLNTQGEGVVAMIGGQRLLIGPTADGWVVAVKVRTGEEVWKFHLSQRGLNVSPVVDGNIVYVAHSEENVDEGVLGRVVAFDGSGSGDITGSSELWRREILSGYSSPLFHDGRLYVVDNSANLHALDGKTGAPYWEHNFGTVGKGSPVWADGKIYVTEVNGNLQVIEPGDKEAKTLSQVHVTMPEGRYAEVYSSPAVAYGRIYFVTENGIFCVGDKNAPFEAKGGPARDLGEQPPAADAKTAALQVVPAEVVTHSGKAESFEVWAYDAQGRSLGAAKGASFSLAGLTGTLDGGTFTADPKAGTQVGLVTAKLGDLTASARVRAVGPLPWSEDFEGIEVGAFPKTWLGVAGKASVQAVEGEEGKILVKGKPRVGVPRADFLLGSADMAGYTIQADLKGIQEGRRRPDLGLVNSGYTLDLQGNHQRLQIRSWAAELRMAKTMDFAWETGVWYTMKMRVDQAPGKTVIHGKVWKRGEPEPEAWTLSAEDPHPIPSGSPGLYGYSPVEIYYDNVKVTVSE
jgi:outer membrane protein assembly factor BamB